MMKAVAVIVVIWAAINMVMGIAAGWMWLRMGTRDLDKWIGWGNRIKEK